MSPQYRYDHRPAKPRRRRLIGAIVGVFMIIAIVGGLLLWDIRHSQSGPLSTHTASVEQVQGNEAQRFIIDEPSFTFELPGDWKETGRKNEGGEHSITWQATRKNEDNRYFKLYIDTIPPTKPVNRLVPLTPHNDTLSVGDISENCSTFTGTGTLSVAEAQNSKPTPAKWQGVDFICNLPAIIDREVGTGSPEGINTVSVVGPAKGKHKYFFLYTDHNIQPDYTIFTDALRSFKAK